MLKLLMTEIINSAYSTHQIEMINIKQIFDSRTGLNAKTEIAKNWVKTTERHPPK